MNVWQSWQKRRYRHAAKLFLRNRGGTATRAEDQRLTRWVAKESNEREYELMQLVWQMSEELKGDPTVDVLRYAPAKKSSKPVYFRIGFALAGVLGVALGVTILIPQIAFPTVAYSTGIGEQRNVVLPDGSNMFLNTVTTARIQYSPFHRMVYLEAGEATFEVKKNPLRPFEVKNPRGAATALGTKFDVFIRPNSMEIAVVEGRVAVRAENQSRPVAPVTLYSGQLATIDARASIILGVADVSRIVGHRVQTLEFANVTVAEAIAEFNLYSRRQVSAVDPRIAKRRVSGVFHAGDSRTFVDSLAAMLNVRAIDNEAGLVLAPQ